MKGSIIFKRVGAYLIDLLVISLVSVAMTRISFINPNYDKEIEIEEFNEKAKEYSYKLNKNGYVYIIGDIIVIFLYFGVFTTITKGQTLGKKMLGLKIVSNKEDKELKWYNYFIRAFILYGVILNLFILVGICFKASTYYRIYTIGSNLDSILSIIITLMILFNTNGRGLHDILAGTRVIDLKLPLDEQTVKKSEK